MLGFLKGRIYYNLNNWYNALALLPGYQLNAPLMEKMNSMAGEVSVLSASLNEKQKMARVLDDVLKMSKQMNKALPAVAKDMPELSGNILKLTKNLTSTSKHKSH